MMAVVVLLDALCNIYDIDARARGQRTLEAQLLTDLGNAHPFFGSKDCFAWVGLVVKPDKIDSPNPVLWMYTYVASVRQRTSGPCPCRIISLLVAATWRASPANHSSFTLM